MSGKNVTIIGGGPAGIACAIQLCRYGINVQVIEKSKIGGLLHNAYLVENYPGFPEGVSGTDLADLFRKQFEQSRAEIYLDCVESVNYINDLFDVKTSAGHFSSPILVIASGTKSKKTDGIVISESVLPLVFYEVAAMPRIEHKHIIIVGAGDAAFDYALNLADKNEVIIINRGNDTRCLPLLWERSKEHSYITYRPATVVLELSERGSGGRVLAHCATSDGQMDIEADYALFAIGREPNVDFLTKDFMAEARSLEDQGRLHFIGDVRSGIFRQTSIAVGDGIRAAMKIGSILREITP